MIARRLPLMLEGGQMAPLVARALRALVDGDRHQEVLSFLLDQIKLLLKSREAHLHQLIEERVREQGGRLVGWAIGGSVASRVLSAINLELDRTDPRDSDMREAATVWIRREIDLIETDPQRGRELADVLRGLVTHDSLRAWAADVWARLRGTVEASSTTRMAGCAGWWATRWPARRRRWSTTSGCGRRSTAPPSGWPGRRCRGCATPCPAFIAQVIGGWDTARLVERIELRVGGDLQFVRINGTLVGCLVGVLLYLGVWLLSGAEAG